MSTQAIKIGLIGGSGLNDPKVLQNPKEIKVTTPFGNPSDLLIEGQINNINCVFLARHGRKHTILPSNINYRANIWALQSVGCTHILASTATGSLREDIVPGTLIILDSFIDRTYCRKQTFFDGGPGSPEGICHIPMNPAFCPRTRDVLKRAAEELKLEFKSTGTCVVIEGPRFSSLAESKLFQSWGADLVNMTTVPEVILAKEAGICYAAVALATDYDCWRETGEKVSVDEVITTFRKNVQKIVSLFTRTVSLIHEEDWEEILKDMKAVVKNNTMLPH